MMNLLYWLLIGLAAGWLGARIMGSGKAGVLGMLVVGMIGSILGGLVVWLLGFSATGLWGELVSATVGAVLFIWLLRRFAG